MNYAAYVYASYAVFAVVMLWDLLAPLLGIRQTLRAVRLRAQRKTSKAEIDTALAEVFGDGTAAQSKDSSQ